MDALLTLLMFAYFGGFFLVPALLAFKGYDTRQRLPGWNRWYTAAVVTAVLAGAACFFAHHVLGGMKGAISG